MFINEYVHPCYKQDDIAMQRINEEVPKHLRPGVPNFSVSGQHL